MTDPSRRGLFGLLAGAAVAPVVGKDVVDDEFTLDARFSASSRRLPMVLNPGDYLTMAIDMQNQIVWSNVNGRRWIRHA